MNCSSASVLPAGYTVQVDAVDKAGWHDVLERFGDANIYQTWSYEAMRGSKRSASHLVLSRNGEVVAAAQARVVRVPFTNIGVAYVRWGPLWQLRGQTPDPEVFALAVRSIRAEYAVKRRLSVRILPYVHEDQRDAFHRLFCAEQFERVAAQAPQRTLLISLGYPLEELRARMEQKWRNCLNRAERSELVIEEGMNDDLFQRFIRIYTEMHDRKRFVQTSDVNLFRAIQRDLPERHKLRIFIATTDGQPSAGVVCSQIGDFGIFLYGATSDAGMGTKASYLLQWRVVTWLKQRGAVCYNLHGINATANPGTYRFKAGLCGRSGSDLRYLGLYESCSGTSTRRLMGWADSIRRIYMNGRTAVRQLHVSANG